MSAPGLILLAAGGSTRMGQSKQLLPYRGGTLLSHACQTALAVKNRGPVIVVLGKDNEACRREISDLPVIPVENRDWEKGLGTSVAAGIAALTGRAPEASGALLMLADQPSVTVSLLEELRARWSPPHFPIAATAYPEGNGVPALFDRSFFSELGALNHDRGARTLIEQNWQHVASVHPGTPLIDLDTLTGYRDHLQSE